MPLPEFIATPLFRRIYPSIRKKEGSPIPPIRRRVTLMDAKITFEFNRLFNTCLLYEARQPIEYTLSYPKIDFLNYLCDWRGLVTHGSNDPNLAVLEPVRMSTDSSEFGNRQQVFASPDAIWAMWFAILDKSKFHTTRNGCIGIGGESKWEKYYHFELEKSLKDRFPFTTGMLYFFRADDFPSRHVHRALNLLGGDIEEWGSEEPVKPIAKIRVEPMDFPYLDKIQYCI